MVADRLFFILSFRHLGPAKFYNVKRFISEIGLGNCVTTIFFSFLRHHDDVIDTIEYKKSTYCTFFLPKFSYTYLLYSETFVI